MTDEFWRWDALDLARAIRTRAVSSREAVEAALGGSTPSIHASTPSSIGSPTRR